MTYENIQIQYGNFTIDRSGAVFYTFDHVAKTLIAKTPNTYPTPPTVVQTYSLSLGPSQIGEVFSLQFDGYYYWTLERPVETGFRVRKWEIGSDNLVRIITEFFFASDNINTYDVHSIAVEHYEDSMDNQVVTGTSTFDVVDGDEVRVGDDIVIGPSTATGFVGIYNFVSVISKTDKTITVSPALSATFSPNDKIVFTRAVHAFSDTAPSNLLGALYTFRSKDGFFLSMDVAGTYANVRASTFFKNKIMFIRGNEVIWLHPDSKTIFKSQAIANSTKDRAGIVPSFDLAGFSETIYRLDQEHVYYDDTPDKWETESWAPLFNYNTEGTVPEIFFVALKADPQILHRSATGIPTEDLESVITVTVLDQFRTPVSGRTVDFSTTHGPLSSIQETTDADGQARVIYTATTAVVEAAVTAIVT